jgi:hypothetical protein
MTQFTFQATDDDGVVVTVEFETDVWLDAFPKFLQLCKGSGFIIDEGAALYAPTASRALFDDRDFLIFKEENQITEEYMDEEEPPFPMTSCSEADNIPCSKTLEQWVAEGHPDCSQHTDEYYDGSRNK